MCPYILQNTLVPNPQVQRCLAWTQRRRHFENLTCQYKYKSLCYLDAAVIIGKKTTDKVGKYVH